METTHQKLNRLTTTQDESGILPCCQQTIKNHVKNNPMMVCPDCKLLIKCYLNHEDYTNFLKFCSSKKRKVKTGKVLNYYTIVYNTYD